MLGIIIAILLLGVLLLLLEILFVPGTTVVGIGGLVLLAIGIYLAYATQGARVGHIAVSSSTVVVVLALIVLLKGKTWERLALKDTITGVSGQVATDVVIIGEKGTTVGRLNPSGKANFGDQIVEVHTSGDFIDGDTPIEVVKVTQNRIQVQRI